MSKRGKKYEKARAVVAPGAVFSVKEAIAKVKDLAYAKFDESIDVNVNVGIDASKGDQVVRGSVVLPHSRGRKARVIVFAKGDYAEKAQKAGADYVGADDLIEKINAGWMEFDFAVATPDIMGAVGKLAKLLGPRGLLPNKKLGTVTFDVDAVVRDLKQGRVFFKNDKNGIVHFAFARVSLAPQAILDNLAAFVRALSAVKPASSKGKFLRKMTISSTMGVGVAINPEEVLRS